MCKARLALHSRRPAPDVLLDDLPDSNELPDNLLERLELEALIRQLVRELPARLREAVSLFYFEGYDSDDAARFLEIPAGRGRRFNPVKPSNSINCARSPAPSHRSGGRCGPKVIAR